MRYGRSKVVLRCQKKFSFGVASGEVSLANAFHISYRAWLQAMKRQRGAVHQFFLWSKKHTGSATHARLNTQRK